VNERLLQFIWQFQYFNQRELLTTNGEPVQLINPGRFNTNQGPDFLEAKVRIGTTLWVGSIELHIRSSDWKKHKHQNDKNYRNVMLHVVWEDDCNVTNDLVPTLELKGRIPKLLLRRYEDLMKSAAFIACEKMIHTTKDITWKSWKDRLVAERLIYKSNLINNHLSKNNHHWEETFWQMLARNFGIPVNADAFEAIAKTISLKIMANQKNDLQKLEALLLGQAGLLNEKFNEEYPRLIQAEYKFQQIKYNLTHARPNPVFLRMRPGNFPGIRLAQLAVLFHKSTHLFTKIKEENSLRLVKEQFAVSASEYWDTHYRFDEISSFKKKRLGTGMIDSIVINTIVPLLFVYGQYHREHKYTEKALRWLEETTGEKNSITDGFRRLSIQSQTAYDSQALIELKKHYCDRKRCLDCSVGSSLLREE
jgi:hypothetical protein